MMTGMERSPGIHQPRKGIPSCETNSAGKTEIPTASGVVGPRSRKWKWLFVIRKEPATGSTRNSTRAIRMAAKNDSERQAMSLLKDQELASKKIGFDIGSLRRFDSRAEFDWNFPNCRGAVVFNDQRQRLREQILLRKVQFFIHFETPFQMGVVGMRGSGNDRPCDK